jgi:hypothetical protein
MAAPHALCLYYEAVPGRPGRLGLDRGLSLLNIKCEKPFGRRQGEV